MKRWHRFLCVLVSVVGALLMQSFLILRKVHVKQVEIQSKHQDDSPQIRLKVPTPIFVASLPKSGTTSIARYFYCGEVWTAHTFVNTPDGRQIRLGECFQRNVALNKSVWDNCGNYRVWSDAGFVRGKRCFYPSVHGLEQLYRSHPNSTILLVKRDKHKWYDSLSRWKGGNLIKKWGACEGFPDRNANETSVMDFYEGHAERIRRFARDHPSMTYLEFQLEDQNIAQKLEAEIGIPASCLGHHNSHEKKMKVNPKFRKQVLEQQKLQNS